MFCQKRISWNQNLQIILILGKEKKDQVNPVSNKMKWKECSKEFCFFEKWIFDLIYSALKVLLQLFLNLYLGIRDKLQRSQFLVLLKLEMSQSKTMQSQLKHDWNEIRVKIK